MTTYALVSVSCPHCHGHFLDRAKLIRPGGKAWCPSCEVLFALDEGNEAMRKTLAEAKSARRRRKERLAELKSRWMDVPPPSQPAPMLMSDVLRALDDLLVRMDALSARKHG